MATYTVPDATTAAQSLPTPTADAWVQPLGGNIFVAEGTLDTATAGVVMSGVPYPVTAGKAVRYASTNGGKVSVRMWDKT